MSNNYLITLVRQGRDGSRDVHIPSLARDENKGILTATQFGEGILPAILGNAEWQLSFYSNPDEFGILAITCNIGSAEKIQNHSKVVSSVLHLHEHCISDPWDLLPHLEDDNTQRAFAELRNERRFQKDVQSAWARTNRAHLRELCADFIDISNKPRFNLLAIGNYLGLSVNELSQFMIVSPEHLDKVFPGDHTPDNVTNRARALTLIAFQLRKLFGTNPRATDWMLRTRPEGWHYNNKLSAKDCLLTGYYSQVFTHLAEVTHKPDRPFERGSHLCSHDFYGASRRF